MRVFSFHKLEQRREKEAIEQSTRAAVYKRRLVQEGLPVFKKYDIQGAYIFGSVAAGKCRNDSDIDLYVYPLPARSYWSFKHDLEESTQLPIDLYTDSDDQTLLKKIISRGVKVYGLQ